MPKLRLHIPIIYNRNNKLYKTTSSLIMNKINEVVIDNVKYIRSDFLKNNGNKMPDYYRLIKNNINHISKLQYDFKTDYYLEKGTFHNLKGAAIFDEEQKTYFIQGFHMYEYDYHRSEKRKKLLIKEKRQKILNKLL